jgi:hypothetical protein
MANSEMPQSWPALIAWLLVRAPLIALGFIAVLYMGFVISIMLRGSSFVDALQPRNFVGRDCIQITEQAGRVFQVDQCRGSVTELPR